MNIIWIVKGEVSQCPEGAVCSVGMDPIIILGTLIAFCLGVLMGWLMRGGLVGKETQHHPHVDKDKEQKYKDKGWKVKDIKDKDVKTGYWAMDPDFHRRMKLKDEWWNLDKEETWRKRHDKE